MGAFYLESYVRIRNSVEIQNIGALDQVAFSVAVPDGHVGRQVLFAALPAGVAGVGWGVTLGLPVLVICSDWSWGSPAVSAHHLVTCTKWVGRMSLDVWENRCRRHTMADKHVRRCSASLAIREMQIRTTVRHRLTPVRTAAIEKSTDSKCWRGCGEEGTSYTLGGNAN